MSDNSKIIHPVRMSVDAGKKDQVTTLLQSGIELESKMGVPMGVFLNSLPDFDMEYLSDRVQTIFLDGNALDDLETRFTSTHHTIALSAAMPGLAGAIFRRNSLCAALRTQQQSTDTNNSVQTDIRIRLKLFNAIAQEKGRTLLNQGGIFLGKILFDFFDLRPSLLSAVTSLTVDNIQITPDTFLDLLRQDEEYLLSIVLSDTAD